MDPLKRLQATIKSHLRRMSHIRMDNVLSKEVFNQVIQKRKGRTNKEILAKQPKSGTMFLNDFWYPKYKRSLNKVKLLKQQEQKKKFFGNKRSIIRFSLGLGLQPPNLDKIHSKTLDKNAGKKQSKLKAIAGSELLKLPLIKEASPVEAYLAGLLDHTIETGDQCQKHKKSAFKSSEISQDYDRSRFPISSFLSQRQLQKREKQMENTILKVGDLIDKCNSPKKKQNDLFSQPHYPIHIRSSSMPKIEKRLLVPMLKSVLGTNRRIGIGINN